MRCASAESTLGPIRDGIGAIEQRALIEKPAVPEAYIQQVLNKFMESCGVPPLDFAAADLLVTKAKFEAILAIDAKDVGAAEGLSSVNAAITEAEATKKVADASKPAGDAPKADAPAAKVDAPAATAARITPEQELRRTVAACSSPK